MHAEVLAIGDEITSGQTLDTNSQWLSQRLEELGVRVLFHTTVGDELAPSVEAFQAAIRRADLVVATGGLGPTADDLTREALAQATGRSLQTDPAALEHVREMFARRGWSMTPNNELQARFPEGSRAIPNPHGTAPGIEIEIPRVGCPPCRVFCLPGVPAEMVEMWNETVAPAVCSAFRGVRVVRRRLLRCFGAGESRIEAMLPDLIRRGRRPTVGITASRAIISLRLVADGETEQECETLLSSTVAEIRRCLGPLVFGEEGEDLQDVAVRLLRERGRTLATAECGTAGLLAEQLGGVAGWAGAYCGGLVLSNTTESAETMAANCRRPFGADFGLAIGPFPAAVAPAGQTAGNETMGSATVALATDEGVRSKQVPLGVHPNLWRIYCVKHALNLLRLTLLG